MNYGITRQVRESFDEAVGRVTAALKEEGFGVLTDIDVQATLKEKLGVAFRRYRILGACNPPFAHRALQTEDWIGLLLPCNVVVQERADGTVEIGAIDPVVAMDAIANPALREIATAIRDRLRAAIAALADGP